MIDTNDMRLLYFLLFTLILFNVYLFFHDCNSKKNAELVFLRNEINKLTQSPM